MPLIRPIPLRFWFVAVYAVGLTLFLVLIFRFRAGHRAVEQQKGPLPPPPALLSWAIPPIILLIGIGQIQAEWIPLRLIGVLLSLYTIVTMPWATAVLGRSFAPGAAVMVDHALVTSGPFRFVRHPICSAVAALSLGAAIGALNWILLVVVSGDAGRVTEGGTGRRGDAPREVRQRL